MVRRIGQVIICFAFLFPAYANKIPAPPPSKDIPREVLLYLYELYNNHNNLERTTTNPTNTRIGDKNDVLIYENGGLYYLCVNIDGVSLWSGINIEALP